MIPLFQSAGGEVYTLEGRPDVLAVVRRVGDGLTVVVVTGNGASTSFQYAPNARDVKQYRYKDNLSDGGDRLSQWCSDHFLPFESVNNLVTWCGRLRFEHVAGEADDADLEAERTQQMQ